MDFETKQDTTFIFYPANLALPSNSNSHYVKAEAPAVEMKQRASRKQARPQTLQQNQSVGYYCLRKELTISPVLTGALGLSSQS